MRSIYAKVFISFVGMAMLLLFLFSYIAFIDTEKILHAYVTKDVVDITLYDETLTQEENVERTLLTLKKWFVLDLFFCFILVAGLSYWIAHSIVKPINQAINYAKVISRGDFSNQIKHARDDEIGALLNALIQPLCTGSA